MKVDPLTLLQDNNDITTVLGPMVRYSKLSFRELCKFYNTEITYTPMILAREYVRNSNARISDLSINSEDGCTIAQVGVNNVTDLMRFIEMVGPYVDGIGINCGCPIREQVREGIGCAMIYNEDLLIDMVKAVKDKYGSTLRLETKIRIHENGKPERTVKLCKNLCKVGVDWITIHGRTRTTRSSEPVDLKAIKFIVEQVRTEYPDSIFVANGDCFNDEDMQKIAKITGVQGVMSARGILSNPALFDGYKTCPWKCVERFMYIVTEHGALPFALIQHHLYCMFENMKSNKLLLKELMELKHLPSLIDWLDQNFSFKRHGEEGFAQAVEIPYRAIQQT
ncbi:hypothetical protein KAFR_0A05830 [Kazachstania africana CBS 2517]|uniref:tRNA-dihydrouridine synthase n=1 Tax=Kazachstania africana (strain ATCC 22294 / BCRC 22015 / CBS 2517 / CECT 1963 / NBRC 1671 / NRRL Y-8276) TaxID=1071382 RepID=H2ANR8_KAZAF|nr:hypothetical protein KAFR_0A05830 [Kazachstania africana CBS 2517]CCF56018.1 hypothetical protein KAFR_0A05830 [Kazachstania africana CBS 2517]